MAVLQPPPPVPPTYSPAPPPAATTKRRGGCGCGGCLLALALVVVLIAAGIYFLAVVPASAGAPAPAVLTVYLSNVDVGSNNASFNPGRTGETLSAGTTVRTNDAGRASMEFADGSITRLAGGTAVTINQATVDSHGLMHRTILDQDIGRTYSTVQSLVSGGGQFTVHGHGITADVRGTEFEVWIRSDHSALIKLISGKVQVSDNGSVTLSPGQQVAIATNGAVGKPAPIVADPIDPFTAWVGSQNAAAASNQAGSEQTSQSATPLAAAGAQADSAPYAFAGGDLTASLSYRGSLMKLQLIGPAGNVVGSAQGPPPVTVKMPGAPVGMYRARITAVALDHGPEPWAVTFASNAPCTPAQAPASGAAPGAPARLTVSDGGINNSIAQSGTGIGAVHIQPTAGGAIITASFETSGLTLGGTFLVYATSPTVGVTVASTSLDGISIPGQVANQLAQIRGRILESINPGFNVDRVYSCQGTQGGVLIVEGHG
jgi:hypothetical protein